MANMARAQVFISGRVQGVFYRAYTRDQARMRGLTGWVRNLPDGRVYAVFEGDREKIESMLAWCRQGPQLPRLTRSKPSGCPTRASSRTSASPINQP